MTEVTGPDGRRLRTDKSRQRVLDAVMSLMESTGEVPTAQQIADESAMSTRSVFRLFGDMQDLYSEAVRSRLVDLRGRYVAPSVELPLGERLAELVATRVSVHEEISPIRRVVAPKTRNPGELQEAFKSGMEWLRSQVAATFAPELAARAEHDRETVLNALDAVLSWEYWDRLRSVQELEFAAAREVVARTVSSLVEAGGTA